MAKQTEIGYEGKEWKSYQTGGTLVRAADLNNIENGIVEACAGVDELRTKRLPTYVVAQDGDTATQDVYSEDILGPCLILDLATRTTYYETGGEEGGHRKALVSGDEIDDIRDSVSRSSAECLMSSDVTGYATAYRVGDIVTVLSKASSAALSEGELLYTLPEGFRPVVDTWCLCNIIGASSRRGVANIVANADGRVVLMSVSGWNAASSVAKSLDGAFTFAAG